MVHDLITKPAEVGAGTDAGAVADPDTAVVAGDEDTARVVKVAVGTDGEASTEEGGAAPTAGTGERQANGDAATHPDAATATHPDAATATATEAKPKAKSKATAQAAADAQPAAAGGGARESGAGLLSQLWRFRSYGNAVRGTLSLGVVMRIGELAADLATPWPLAWVINTVLRGHDPGRSVRNLARVVDFGFGTSVGLLVLAAVAVLLITALSGLFDYLGDRFMNGAGEQITSAIRRDVYGHLTRLPMTFHDRTAAGELTSRVVMDTSRIEDGLVELFATLVPSLLSLAGYASVLLWLNWRLGAIALAAAPLLFLTAGRYSRLTRVSTRRRRAAEGRLSALVSESLQGIRTVHAFGRQDLHDQQFAVHNEAVLAAGLRSVDLRARFTPMLELIAALGTATMLLIGGYGVLRHWWDLGVLVVVTSYLRDLRKPLKSLSELALTFTRGAASAERLATILDRVVASTTPRHALPERIEGGIALGTVTLDYGRGPILDGINLLIGPGERIALLGHNGAGKSSLLAVIAGLYPPTMGQVRLDRILVDHAPDTWRHQQVAIVLQDTFLFSGTIADNIRYARPEASDAEVAEVARAALVTEFTDQLPDGLNTVLYDGGVGLSGGQRQRVGIARALLADAPIVLLDEPTTGLDVNAEELVIRALTRLVSGRTVIMTTHQPALTRLATRTVYLDHGRLRPNPPRSDQPSGLHPAGPPRNFRAPDGMTVIRHGLPRHGSRPHELS
jgi:ABC-type multidrug transport system fused ATPase/permease subunit